MKRLVMIVNPISGNSSKYNVVGAIASYIDTTKYDVTIRFTSYAGHATQIADEAVRNRVDIVVAVGGDGTVNEVARALVKSNTALGIIPCGSGNGLARHLHIPMNVRKALNVINHGVIDSIDTMTINGRFCFCTAGVGYDAYVTAEYAKDKNRGLLTYAKKVITGWFKYKPQQYIVETDTQVLTRRAVAITCANANQWGNEFHVAPKASLKDSLIDVTIIHPVSFISALAMLRQILGYSIDENPNVEYIKTSKLHIGRRAQDLLQIDGESIWGEAELTLNVEENSLMVIVVDDKDCCL